jgi:hypothetical protein
MQRLEVSGAVRHVYVVRWQRVNNTWCDKVVSGLNVFLLNKASYHCYFFQSSVFGTECWVQWLQICSEHTIKCMVWNLPRVACSYDWIMFTQISHPVRPYAAGGGEQWYDTKSGEYGGYGMTLILFWARNLCTVTAEWVGLDMNLVEI